MNRKEILKDMLRDLVPMIEGHWWLCGGGMLGLHRDKDLIDWDNDLDIMILPNTEITLPNLSNYGLQKYYMDTKFYRKDLPVYKPNLWNEYLRYFSFNKKLNRPTLYSEASKTYKQERITPTFSEPYIDIYTLQKVEGGWVIPNWEQQVYTDMELLSPTRNLDLGFEVPLPGNLDDVCRRCYGDSWKEPIPDEWKEKHRLATEAKNVTEE